MDHIQAVSLYIKSRRTGICRVYPIRFTRPATPIMIYVSFLALFSSRILTSLLPAATPARIAMIAITTRSSMSVNKLLCFIMLTPVYFECYFKLLIHFERVIRTLVILMNFPGFTSGLSPPKIRANEAVPAGNFPV